jgi:hypothetical protein
VKSNSTRNSTEPARRGCPWLIYTTGSKQVEEPICLSKTWSRLM